MTTDAQVITKEAAQRFIDSAAARQDTMARDRQEVERVKRETAWKRLAQRIGIRYSSCRLDNFPVAEPFIEKKRVVVDKLRAFVAHLEDHVRQGSNLVIIGGVGAGKDGLLSAVMHEAIVRGIEVQWENGLDLYDRIRATFGSQDSMAHQTIISELSNAQVLCLSDPSPPSGDPKDWTIEKLFRILDRRARNCRPTWITANVSSSAEANRTLSAPVADRLRDGAVVIDCNWPSLRRPRD